MSVGSTELIKERRRRLRRRAEWRELLASKLHPCARVLELGCGAGDAGLKRFSFYVFNHVPRERLAPLLAKIHRRLVPGGWFMHTFTPFPRADAGFAGVRTHREPESAAKRSGASDESTEPEGAATFQWILARR